MRQKDLARMLLWSSMRRCEPCVIACWPRKADLKPDQLREVGSRPGSASSSEYQRRRARTCDGGRSAFTGRVKSDQTRVLLDFSRGYRAKLRRAGIRNNERCSRACSTWASSRRQLVVSCSSRMITWRDSQERVLPVTGGPEKAISSASDTKRRKFGGTGIW